MISCGAKDQYIKGGELGVNTNGGGVVVLGSGSRGKNMVTR